MIHYLSSAEITTIQIELRLAFRAIFILIISNVKKTKSTKISVFVGLFVSKWKFLLKNGKQMVGIRSRYFHLPLEQIFSDFSFLRSMRHKTRTFDAYVEKGRKRKKKTR
jgi:hypothetical protein